MQTFEETRKLEKKHVGLIYKSLSVQKKLCDLTTTFLPHDLIQTQIIEVILKMLYYSSSMDRRVSWSYDKRKLQTTVMI